MKSQFVYLVFSTRMFKWFSWILGQLAVKKWGCGEISFFRFLEIYPFPLYNSKQQQVHKVFLTKSNLLVSTLLSGCTLYCKWLYCILHPFWSMPSASLTALVTIMKYPPTWNYQLDFHDIKYWHKEILSQKGQICRKDFYRERE